MSTVCSRIIFNDVFNLYKDLYVSFETTEPITNNNGLVIFVTDDEIDDDDISSINTHLSGNGLGILYDTTPQLITGHLISIALDGIGNYGLSNTYTGANQTGIDSREEHSITVRALRDNIPYIHLNTEPVEALKSSTPNTYRIRFKGFLNEVYVDVRQNSGYQNIYSLSTDVSMSDIGSSKGKIGLSYSGDDNFGIKNITYSGELINNSV